MERSDLALVIPAFNEAASIHQVVVKALHYGQPIVVNDASRDDTGNIAQAAGAVVVTHPKNLGYDGALNSGFRRAAELGYRYVITLDADGQHRPELITQFSRRLAAGTPLVLGVRDRKQRFSEHLFAAVTKLLYGVRDPLCGMKGYQMELYQRLGHFDSFGSIGTELALFAIKNQYRFEQIDVPTLDRVGAPRFARLLRANYLITRAMVCSLFKIRRAPPLK